MRWKLLARALWAQHRKVIVAIAALSTLGVVALSLSSSCPSRRGCPCAQAVPAGDDSLVFDRVWFDRYPEAPREEIAVWVYLSDGIGLYQQGSAYRGSFDIFELRREADVLELRWMQDEVVDRTRFSVERCDERPPFDLCLTLDTPARGPSRYYGFSEESDVAAHAPWARRVMLEARAAR